MPIHRDSLALRKIISLFSDCEICVVEELALLVDRKTFFGDAGDVKLESARIFSLLMYSKSSLKAELLNHSKPFHELIILIGLGCGEVLGGATNNHFLRQIRESIQKNAKLFIRECLLNDEKHGIQFRAIFNLMMLLNHSSQQFTKSELTKVLVASGFSVAAVVAKASHYSLLVASVA